MGQIVLMFARVCEQPASPPCPLLRLKLVVVPVSKHRHALQQSHSLFRLKELVSARIY